MAVLQTCTVSVQVRIRRRRLVLLIMTALAWAARWLNQKTVEAVGNRVLAWAYVEMRIGSGPWERRPHGIKVEATVARAQ
jgi:hypothetical protein